MNKMYHYWGLLAFIALLSSCSKTQINTLTGTHYTDLYTIAGSKIYHYNNPVQLIGANTFHVFAAGGFDMNSWNQDIAREFVGDVKEEPLNGYPVQISNGRYLHSLQSVTDSNRANNRITLICPFGWDSTDTTIFSGKMPEQTFWWNDYKNKLQQWARQFKNQPDVWLELWNEPYSYNGLDGYTDDIWVNDMNQMVDIIRATGNQNVIVVPCAAQGQDETVLNNKGFVFLTGKTNILFDIHAYEKWLFSSNAVIGNRLKLLKQNNLPVIFGETAPINAGVVMNPKPFLDSVYYYGLSVCAWQWKYDSNDRDALLNTQGFPNDNNNNNWGTSYKTFSLQIRNPNP